MTQEKKKILELLKESPFFRELPEEILKEIALLGKIKIFEKNELIFSEGETAYGFYLISEGLVKIYKLSPKGKEQILHLLTKGEVFAEIVLMGTSSYPAWAQALTKLEVVFFDKNKFLNLVKQKPDLALNFIGILILKIKNLVKTIENLGLKEAEEKLIHYLWELSQEGKKESFFLKIPKSQLALLLGITPETLSRIFRKLKEENLVEINGREIKILNMENLRKYL
ncbi:MAG: Crp/Fnr family transcriptional regulator [Thermodesulfobacteriaceae bacterium]|nr:Crp/Fnr family transcriptional regulator [Thermodesulfobacteriaceae bacterium]MCX8042217.1 Crp/Fnr family transcriptional regulator [Thermodesulfobacteriaceae bacterium]MDW8136617.1 Crp/Fnr family transcriptional regulator [Thermodesulfobacterium sp.]